MDITILVLGDESDEGSYNEFCKQLQKHHSKKLNWVTGTYDLLEKNELPMRSYHPLIIFI